MNSSFKTCAEVAATSTRPDVSAGVRAPAASAGRGRFVYVVDDNPSICQAFELLLAAHGYDVVSFLSGQSFVDHADLSAGVALLLDQSLPGISGIEVLQHLRQRNCNLPVIVITGNGRIRNAVDAMKLGAVDYLEKPLEEQAVLDWLHKVTPCAAPPAEAGPVLALLTLRERQVLEQLALGLSSKEVARVLDISPRTVDVHRCNILTKLGANSMLVAIRMAGLERMAG